MNKKKYLAVVALVCALFCTTVTQAQERLWGLSAENAIFSVYKDGSDYKSFSFFDSLELGSNPVRIQKLSNGEMLVVMGSGGSYDAGTICKITSTGAVKLYDIPSGFDLSDITFSFEEGKDGYGYAWSYSVLYGPRIWGIIRFSLDGTSYEGFPMINKDVVKTSGLTATTQGVYGVTKGNQSNGGIYKLRADLSGVDIIYNFTDGKKPMGRLLEGRDGYLYGTTNQGGLYGYGTIYKINQDGSDFVKLHDFDHVNGRNPVAGLVQDAQGVLYGTTRTGGLRGRGVLFKMNEDGTDFQKLLDYDNIGSAYPTRELLVDNDGFIYDSFYKIKTNGTQFSLLETPGLYLHSFSTSFTPDVYIVNPADQSSNQPVDLVLQAKPFSGATQYDIVLSESPDFSSGVQQFSSVEPSVNVTGLKHGTTYYTRVKANIWPYYGPVSTFTTEDQLNDVTETLDVYPNPSSHTFIYKGSSFGKALTVTDLNGTVVYQNEKALPEESLEFGDNLKKGVYILNVQDAAGIKTIRLIKK